MSINAEVLLQLADKVKYLREVRDTLEDKNKQANEELRRAERDLTNLMVSCETTNFTKSGTQFSVVTKMRASAVSERKKELFDALRAQGYGSLVTETVNANSLSSFVKECMEENKDALPQWLDGLVNTYEQTQVQLRKSKQKTGGSIYG